MKIYRANLLAAAILLLLVKPGFAQYNDYDYESDYESDDNPTCVHNIHPADYHGSFTVINDLVSTKVEASFDWTKKRMNGKATIVLKPHWAPTDTVTLNAKGMNLNEVSLVTATGKTPLHYIYDSTNLRIDLPKTYLRDEKFTLFIDYVSKPEERSTEGSSAINEDKGLYFINADGAIAGKPREIWTQGETESNSVWVPTIDKPNMRSLFDCTITIDTGMVTLSNGLMVSSVKNANGTHTDHWVMDQPIAPYLFMMAMGRYSVIKDHWKTMEVNYYVERKYAPYAKEIFGNTPEMIDFYSKTLGVDFAWKKYSQIVVRDFVAGAMENATATVHFEQLQKTHREMIDGNLEDIISHELFHQWFGDLVTCESWSNIPLNESFATYGEYLWMEHKYGREKADDHINADLKNVIYDSDNPVPIVRYQYDNREDLFDANSYQRGGRVLHMLRKYLGDEAFFKGLGNYLKDHAYTAVEMADLRQSFEKLTGQDLSWFFNQWWLSPGYPVIEIHQQYMPQANEVKVTIEQTQSTSGSTPVFRIPMWVDVYFADHTERHWIDVQQADQDFYFAAYSKPKLVNVDAEKMLLCEKTDNKPDSQWVYQYYHAPLFMDRLEAIEYAKDNYENNEDDMFRKMLLDAMNDKNEVIRMEAIDAIHIDESDASLSLRNLLINLAKSDKSSLVRSDALSKLADLEDEDLLALFEGALKDSSYKVLATALNAIKDINAKTAYTSAHELENEDNSQVANIIANLYSEQGDESAYGFFEKKLTDATNDSKYLMMSYFGTYLARMLIPAQKKGLELLYTAASKEGSWWARMGAMNAINKVKDALEEKDDPDSKALSEEIEKKVKEIKAAEKNSTLQGIWGTHDDEGGE